MALYPSTAYRLDGWNPLRISAASHIKSLETGINRRISTYAGDWQVETASYPNGTAPGGSIWLPITAGGMSAQAKASITGAANLLSGGPMQASFAADITGNTPSMSLVISMHADFTGTSAWDANLRMTVGMHADFDAALTGTCNLAMIVPFGSAAFTSGISGTADLKGTLSMSASFGGADPLTPAGFWEYALEGDYSAAEIMRIMAAALAGKTSGQATSPVFRSIDDTANRIAATVSASGNRTAVTLNP